jgi:hypothetical protein
MPARSQGVSSRLLEKLLRDQERRAERERKMPFAEKLKVLDQLMAERFAAEEKARVPAGKLQRHGRAGPGSREKDAGATRKPRSANDR